MMKTLYNLIALVAIANLLILGGFAGFLLLSGKLNAGSAEIIAAALRGEKMIPAATTQPATQPASQPSESSAANKKGDSFEGIELQLARLERARKELDDRYSRLKDAEFKLIKDREALTQQEKDFRQQLKLQQQATTDEGFNKALLLYTQMPPKAAKDDFMKLDADIVVRYLTNMKKQNSSKILKEFKSPEEEKRRQEIMERIRTREIVIDQAPAGKEP
jgi:flagellar motility protein MotE (MotC chaperone)